MMYLNRTVWLRFAIALTVGSLLVFGCTRNTEPEDEPPTIPVTGTFIMDFDSFPSTPAGLLAVGGGQPNLTSLSRENWGWAAVNVTVWSTLLAIGSAVPAAAFVEAFAHEPTQGPGGTWVWSYSFTFLNDTYTASLHADVDRDGVNWEMYISKENGYTDFLWYSGWSNFPATEGTWTVNFSPDNPIPWIGIEWHRNPEDSTGDIKYTNIVPDGPENGGYIFFGTTIAVPDIVPCYDAFYDIYNKGKNNHTDINWNRTTFAGQVSDSLHFGDTDWHCWDGNLEDKVCP